MNGRALDDFIAQYLPTAQHMELSVKHYDGKSLSVHAPLAPSINDKLTAFGGSIYCVAVMACWGMTYLRCVDYGLDPDIVVAEASIEYLKPVTGDIIGSSIVVDEEKWQHFFKRFEERGRAKIDLQSEILVDGEVAVRFKGLYAIVGVK
ncbi:MAG: YiiD C-terminal domain-containing protein [Zhongshania sp.]|uniref:YiiD C-terminal domain-containing protein n=1 Tax=Zhongshania guokunii TaxID=641783 RepID=A0ABV3U9S4_9GAMM|nr:YiiD C-terminal domain-containing protein [Zhongshania sp.]MDF1691811.1 YiiD C-terminal domain-containing protein [Zhongshania sp.]